MMIRTALAATAVGVFASTSVAAQPAPSPGSREAIPEKQGEPLHDGRSASENLSKDLSKSDGVIKPKGNVDPEMRAPAPDPTPHATPVIPPSATGGDNAK